MPGSLYSYSDRGRASAPRDSMEDRHPSNGIHSVQDKAAENRAAAALWRGRPPADLRALPPIERGFEHTENRTHATPLDAALYRGRSNGLPAPNSPPSQTGFRVALGNIAFGVDAFARGDFSTGWDYTTGGLRDLAASVSNSLDQMGTPRKHSTSNTTLSYVLNRIRG